MFERVVWFLILLSSVVVAFLLHRWVGVPRGLLLFPVIILWIVGLIVIFSQQPKQATAESYTVMTERLEQLPERETSLFWSSVGDEKALRHCWSEVERLSKGSGEWEIRNEVLCTLITFGFYKEALGLMPRGMEYKGLRHDRLECYLLSHINAAEAEYNLGLYDEALARLGDVDAFYAQHKTEEIPIVRGGALQQRAWLYALQDRLEEAEKVQGQVQKKYFPEDFYAEYYFTWGLIDLKLGNMDDARCSIELGLATSLRVSSRRNGLFLLAELCKKAGFTEDALLFFEHAVSHQYIHQGGDGLRSYGELLLSLERKEEAQKVFTLLKERDPQSFAACSLDADLTGLSQDSSVEPMHA